MRKRKTQYINADEQKGEQSLKGLLKQTKPKEEEKPNTIIKDLEEQGVFD